MIIDNLNIDSDLTNVVASIVEQKHKNQLNVRIFFGNDKISNDVEVIQGDKRRFEVFDHNITSDRVSHAIRWLVSLDSNCKERLLSGRQVNVQIPYFDKVNYNLPSRIAHPDKYRELRPPVSYVIRPVFLKYPQNNSLYNYQREGIDYLLKTKSIILADDMGLGKTLQAIFSIRILFHIGAIRSALVISPKTLIANWIDELRKWAPELYPIAFSGNNKEKDLIWSIVYERFHVIIANYEQIREPSNAMKLSNIGVIVADEAHRIRKMSSLVTKGIRQLKSDRFWALTGTPIEKNVDDLVTILSTIEPKRFSASYSRLDFASLRSRYKEYILRRTKSNVLKDLPKASELSESIELSEKQKHSYNQAIRKIDTKEKDVEYIISIINKLKIICDYDPVLFNSSKLDRIEEILGTILANGEKVIVFSYLLKPLYILKERLDKNYGRNMSVILEGDMKLGERSRALNSFKSRNQVNILLASTRVASEGINLTEANNVIFVNQWWNPSSNKQAIDRVVRIGQKKPVFIYKFTTKNTIEEYLEMILRKKERTYYELVDKISVGSKGIAFNSKEFSFIYRNILRKCA